MAMRHPISVVLLGAWIGYGPNRVAAEDGPSADAIRAALGKALPLLEKSSDEYTRHRQCFACHHQLMPVLALTAARSRGLRVNDEIVQQQVAFTAKSLANNRENYAKGKGQGGQISTAGSALWTLEAGGWKNDQTTSAVVEYLLLWDRDPDHWRTTSKRPPSEASNFTTTYLALRGIEKYGSDEQKKRLTERKGKIRNWLAKTKCEDTEDQVFRLLALSFVDDRQLVEDAVEDLKRRQNKDGGFCQIADRASDAYATGSTLVALHMAGGLQVNDRYYRRGLQFLIDRQQADGSWLVESRSKPFQVYFESGFPHGKNQFISIAASSWAAYALALACEEKPARK